FLFVHFILSSIEARNVVLVISGTFFHTSNHQSERVSNSFVPFQRESNSLPDPTPSSMPWRKDKPLPAPLRSRRLPCLVGVSECISHSTAHCIRTSGISPIQARIPLARTPAHAGAL